MDENMENSTPTPGNQPSQEPMTPQPQAAPKAVPNIDISQDSKNMGMLCHLLAIFTVFLCPLIIWLNKKDEDDFVNSQGKEALNFQLTIMFAIVVSCILIPIFIGIFMLFATVVCNIVFCILASISASKGQDYRYPLCIRLVK